MDEGGELTIGALDGARIPLRYVQTVQGNINALLFHVAPAESLDEATVAALADLLDRMIASARPALPGETILDGDEADAAARKLFKRLRDV
jgi:hypothetical protein